MNCGPHSVKNFDQGAKLSRKTVPPNPIWGICFVYRSLNLHSTLTPLHILNDRPLKVWFILFLLFCQIRLNVSPEKGWHNEDMFLPPGYHINAEIKNEGSSDKSVDGQNVYTYPAGIGSVIMNGCWGTGYQNGDPCHKSLTSRTACKVSLIQLRIYH